MTRSVPTSLAGVTHYGDLGANFNQGGPSVRRLPRLCWRELQPRMPQCTSLVEVVLVRTSIGDAPVYIAWKSCASANFNRRCPSACAAVLGKAREAGSHDDRGEDRGWSTREGWHNSPVVRGGWPGWTTSDHSTSRRGEVKTAGGLPAKQKARLKRKLRADSKTGLWVGWRYESDLPSLGIRGKSRGSVRDSGDSVERLEECSGARACTFGELGARGVRLECTVGGREASGARGVCAGARLDARARGSVRLRVHCSPESTSFTRNHLNDLK
ncbi:hypothetical protein CRG98_001423 [Punica granatum]|uniref:Uncharacterized protein n=1 Tax=Punica granatum TaxID=22663 RepID=A0A2I0LBY3_PUNGR|nr:hypothetical protein CRG98_001423 [Punica granatum]